MGRRSICVQGGALAGLALFVAATGGADERLHEEVHRQYKHQSYMLVTDADGARLFLFDNGTAGVMTLEEFDPVSRWMDVALARLQSTDPRVRVRGLTELAGVANPEVLDAALVLLADPSQAVREEAAQLVIDHPHGDVLAAALGLVDEDEED